jgi:hypothetical protein
MTRQLISRYSRLRFLRSKLSRTEAEKTCLANLRYVVLPEIHWIKCWRRGLAMHAMRQAQGRRVS